MKHISILVPNGHFSMVNIEGTHQLFSWINSQAEAQGQAPLFKIELVGARQHVTQTNGLFSIHPDKLIDNINKTDLIIIPAIHGAPEQVLNENKDFLPWIKMQYEQGAKLCSYCIATFFLGATGLLNGKVCSTHWYYADQFRQMYPEAILCDDKILTDCEGIYTSGGAYSFTNLLIYLVEKYAGRDLAIAAAKSFMIDIDRISQSPFVIFNGQKSHLDESILSLQDYIEKNYQEKITIDQLCEVAGIGRRTLERRFKKATGNSVHAYLQRVRVEAAKKALESGRKTVYEAMYAVGYADGKAFREAFRKVTGISPVSYLTKYGKPVAA